ncbi:MAG: hypothetical protein FD183_650 [Chitinophagaceae bacterium]|nr:MAG: hypothetical protein FD183_650 [Chitinophagaceae bacterium]
MNRQHKISQGVDYTVIWLYAILVAIGIFSWLNIEQIPIGFNPF